MLSNIPEEQGPQVFVNTSRKKSGHLHENQQKDFNP
jgi:hypothetical protein